VTTSREPHCMRSFTLPNFHEQFLVTHILFLVVLGARVQPTLDIHDIVNFRLRKANACFFREYDYFARKNIPAVERVARFCSKVITCAAYSSGSWVFKPELARRITAWENNLLRHMFPMRKRPTETVIELIIRKSRHRRKVFLDSGGVSLVMITPKRIWTNA